MKKNLLSILILALLIINIVLTSIMMFSITSASNKTATLVTDIASIIKLEVGTTETETEKTEEVPMKNMVPYDIPEKMTVMLQKDPDGKERFALVSVTLSMNSKADGYKDYGETIATKEGVIKSIINEVMGAYTADEAREEQTAIRAEILKKIQEAFDSDFIFDISFRDIMIQ